MSIRYRSGASGPSEVQVLICRLFGCQGITETSADQFSIGISKNKLQLHFLFRNHCCKCLLHNGSDLIKPPNVEGITRALDLLEAANIQGGILIVVSDGNENRDPRIPDTYERVSFVYV